MNWTDNITNISRCMEALSVLDKSGREIGPESGFESWLEQTRRLRRSQKTIYLIGNGASASMASHMAADLAKNALVRTETFTDLSLITAIANDVGYENVFSEPLKWKMAKGDMLVAISSSGYSRNVLSACELALSLGGYLVSLSAMEPINPLRHFGHLNYYVPAENYGPAETCHACILHYWIDQIQSEINVSKIIPYRCISN